MYNEKVFRRILNPALILAFIFAGLGAVWYRVEVGTAGDASSFTYKFFGGCVGLIVGAIYGATECLVATLGGAASRRATDESERHEMRSLEDRIGKGGIILLATVAAIVTWLIMNFVIPRA